MLHKCRACLQPNDSMKFLTEDEPEGEELLLMYTSVNFKWTKNEEIPFCICSKCKATLKISYKFQQMCLESYEVIKQLENAKDECNKSEEMIVGDFVERIIIERDEESDDNGDINEELQCVDDKAMDTECQKEITKHKTPNNKVHEFYYLAHLKIHSDAKPYQCFLCPSGFLSKCALQAHFGSVHPEVEDKEEKHIVCNTDDLLKSVEVETEVRRQKQDNYCGKCEKQVEDLPAHVTRVQEKIEDERYVCHLCAKELKSAASLKGHLKVHEGDTPFKCSYCGKPQKNNSQLIEHVRTHTGEKPNICDVCGRGFAQVSALGTHMRLHTGRPEECPICGKRFCRPSGLKIHLQRHAGEKPFLCTECGRTFLQKSHLMGHMKTHSEIRPYKCPHCDKAFKQKSLLKSHIQIHSGFKPYECQYCGYAAFKQYRLQQHMKLHCSDGAKKEIHACPICQNGFTSKSTLNTHIKSSHHAIL